MNVFAGKLLTRAGPVSAEDSNDGATYQVCVDIAVEHPFHYRGTVVASDIPLLPLKDAAPMLLQNLTLDGTQILIPRSEAIDCSVVLNLIDAIIDQDRPGKDIKLDRQKLKQNPVELIKLHVALNLSGLSSQAHELLKYLWLVLETHVLTPADVFWIWAVLSPHKNMTWVPEATGTYLQMMAWNILNADAKDRMHPELRTFFLEEEARPYHLTCLLKQHYLKYGLDREPQELSEDTSQKRRDIATENAEQSTSLFTSPSTSLVPGEEPIFPVRWEAPPDLKQPQLPVYIGAFFPDQKWDDRKWSERWDGRVKNVQKMAAERDGLALLKCGGVIPDMADKAPVYREFGYPHWYEKAEKPRKRWDGL